MGLGSVQGGIDPIADLYRRSIQLASTSNPTPSITMATPLDSHPFAHLLTPEESQQVDAALLTSRDKFSVRVALYGLRVLQQVATTAHVPLTQLTPAQIQSWLQEDATATAVVQAQSLEIDSQFQEFWAKLLWSSLKPLQAAADRAQADLAQLTVTQVIAYFEEQGKLEAP